METLYKFSFRAKEGYYTETKSYYKDVEAFSKAHGFIPNDFKPLKYTALKVPKNKKEKESFGLSGEVPHYRHWNATPDFDDDCGSGDPFQ